MKKSAPEAASRDLSVAMTKSKEVVPPSPCSQESGVTSEQNKRRAIPCGWALSLVGDQMREEKPPESSDFYSNVHLCIIQPEIHYIEFHEPNKKNQLML